jgi:hypothetical protein
MVFQIDTRCGEGRRRSAQPTPTQFRNARPVRLQVPQHSVHLPCTFCIETRRQDKSVMRAINEHPTIAWSFHPAKKLASQHGCNIGTYVFPFSAASAFFFHFSLLSRLRRTAHYGAFPQ